MNPITRSNSNIELLVTEHLFPVLGDSRLAANGIVILTAHCRCLFLVCLNKNRSIFRFCVEMKCEEGKHLNLLAKQGTI